MNPNMTKSGLYETPRTKTSPATPRPATPRTSNSYSRLTRTPGKPEAGSLSPLHNSRLSVDRSPGSPRSVDSKLNGVHRSPQNSIVTATDQKRISTSISKQIRPVKGSELQAELNSALEDLKKAKEVLAVVEKEKAQALKELKEARRRADEANDKLVDAVAAKMQAEECAEIEKFRVVEIEQASIDEAQQREAAWQKEMENVRGQHAADITALLSATQELERVKNELAMITEAKNAATIHAEEALSIAEFNVEKVAALSEEVSRLKGLLDSKVEVRDTKISERVKNLGFEIDSLQDELDRAREAGKKLIEMESLVETLTNEVADAKKEKQEASNAADEWKKRAENLEIKVGDAVRSERSASESLAASVKRLEECNTHLRVAESEILCLKGKVESLESQVARQKGDFDESDCHLKSAKQELLKMEKTLGDLKSELLHMEEEKMQALDDGKRVASNLQSLIEEKDKLANELQDSRDEVEKVKRAMDVLASALHEVSTEARDSQERLLIKQSELADAKDKIDELKLYMKSADEKYKAMLREANDEISHLKSIIEKYEMETEILESEMNRKKVDFISSIKKSDDETVAIKSNVDEVANKLEGAELEAAAAKHEGIQLLNRLNQTKLEAASANEAAEEARAESARMKERLLDKENELLSIAQENNDLRIREEAALRKIQELSTQLEEVTARKCQVNGDLPKRSVCHEEESKSAEIPRVSNDGSELHEHRTQILHDQFDELEQEENMSILVNGSGNAQQGEPEPAETEKWIRSETDKKQLSPEMGPEPETLDDQVSPTVEGENLEQKNRISSDKFDKSEAILNKEQHHQKKKTPLLQKFGKMLKRSNHK